MLWVISSIVCCSSCWICSTLSPSSRRVCSSSEAKGSSISRIFGSKASVRAIATRWRMPPDSSDGYRFSKPSKPTRWTKCRARSSRSAFAIPAISNGKAMFSITVRQGKVDFSWNTIPIAECGPDTVSPAMLTRPSWPPIKPPIMLNKVDLPQPDGPITERNSPVRTVKEMRSTAATSPSAVGNCFIKLSTTRMSSRRGRASFGTC